MKPSNKPVRLTPRLLKNIIEEEVKNFAGMEDVNKRADDTEETDADEFADSLDKHIDFMKALKIEEGRLTKRLGRIRGALQKGAKKLVNARVV